MSDQSPADRQGSWESDSDRPAEAGCVVSARPLEAPGYTIWLIAFWVMVVAMSIMQHLAGRGVEGTNPALIILGCVNGVLLVTAVVLQLMWVHRVHQDARTWGGYRDVSPGLALGLAFVPLLGMLWVAWCMLKLAGWYGQGDSEDEADVRRGGLTRAATGIAAVLLVPWIIAVTHHMVKVFPASMAVRRDNPNASPEELREAMQEAAEAAALPEIFQNVSFVLLAIAMLLFLFAVHSLTHGLYAKLATTRGEEPPLPAAAEIPEEGADLWPPGESGG